MIEWQVLSEAAKLLIDGYLLFLMIIGVMLGVVVGSIPGLTGGIGIAIMLPFTYGLNPLQSLVLLLGIYTGGLWGGGVTAILFNTPGSPASAATTLDGYPMTVSGEPGRALGLSLVASTVGGCIGLLVLLFLMQPLSRVVIGMGAPEICMVAVFAFTVVALVKGGSMARSIFAATFGLFIGTIGMSHAGYLRGTYGSVYILDGLPLIPTLIGFFAISEFIQLIEREFISHEKVPKTGTLEILTGVKEGLTYPIAIIRSSLIGVFIGAIPAAGSTVANLVSYNEAKRWSRDSEKFGTGNPDGIVSAEAANNASEGGALLTMLLLGIPGGQATAMMLGALMIQGWIPGTRLIIDHQEVIYAAILAEFIQEIILLLFGIGFAIVVARLINFPTRVLVPCLAVFTVVGALSIRGLMFDAYILIFFGILGYLFKKLDYPLIAVVLGFILGDIVDSELIRVFQRYGDITPFFTRPVSLIFVILSALGLASPYIMKFFRNRQKAA